MIKQIKTRKEYTRRAEMLLRDNPEIGCITVDPDGDVYWFESRPIIGMSQWVLRPCDRGTKLGPLPINVSKKLASDIWQSSLLVRATPIEEVYPIDTLVSVTDNNDPGGPEPILRYSCGRVDLQGLLLCWSSGRTSRTTTRHDCAPWKYVELADK